MDKTCEKNCQCLDCTDFILSSSIYGLKMDEFSFDKETQEKLLRLMARIMERAYRRGVQQAITLYPDGILPEILEDLECWRYENDLDKCPGLRGDRDSSLWRLQCEESLDQIGFYCEDENKWLKK